MASSRGRERLRERQSSGRSFAFGSSTPRDLSHMNKIPPNLRSYDARQKIQREGPDLHVYMEKARSLTREGAPKDGIHRAFGSSTPRDFSHLTGIDPKFRRYDAVIPKKSATSPELQSPIKTKRSITAPPVQRQPAAPKVPEKKQMAKDDDISSEPDFVQDREEFLNDLRKISKQEKAKKEEKNGSTPVETSEETKAASPPPVSNKKRESIGEVKLESTPFTHAAELATEVRLTERIPHNMHEEEEATAQKQTVKGMNDQIVVSELLESKHEADVEEEEKKDEKKEEKKEKMVGEIIGKVEEAADHLSTKIITPTTAVSSKPDELITKTDAVIQKTTHDANTTEQKDSGNGAIPTGEFYI